MDLAAEQAGDTATATAGWYSNAGTDASAASSENILSTAFAHAKLLLKATLDDADYESLFPIATRDSSSEAQQHVSQHTIYDLQRCLKHAQASYEARVGVTNDAFEEIAPSITAPALPPSKKAKAKARIWLTTLSEKLLHYGNIFDVMVQHHPEYVSLAWGTFKLLFTVSETKLFLTKLSPRPVITPTDVQSGKAITNHAETASKLSKSLCQIADLLPQHSLLLILYPTSRMQNSVARLYAHILEFFLSSLKWYRDSRAMHALKSIFQPWDLKFRPEYEAIAEEARQIRRLADVALKAEVRDTRLEVVQGTRHWEAVRQEMGELRAENQRLASLFQSRFGMMEDSMHSMYKEIRLDFASQRDTLNRVHLNQMLCLPLWSSLPTSGESLQFCRSMRSRRRERAQLPLPDIQKLERWSSQRNNPLLLIDTQRHLIAKSFMVDLINLILDHRLPVIWALRYADYWGRCTTVTDIVRMLVLQTMQLGADRLLDGPFPVTVEQLHEAASLSEWTAILNRLLSGIGQVFIVLDADLLAHATGHERSEAIEILETLRLKLVASNVKIVTATWGVVGETGEGHVDRGAQ